MLFSRVKPYTQNKVEFIQGNFVCLVGNTFLLSKIYMIFFYRTFIYKCIFLSKLIFLFHMLTIGEWSSVNTVYGATDCLTTVLLEGAPPYPDTVRQLQLRMFQ